MDVDAVEGQYNGVNVLRCDLDPEGKCVRELMRHRLCYELLYDEQVKYIPVSEGDHEAHLRRKNKQYEDERNLNTFFTSDARRTTTRTGEEEA